MMQDNDGSPGLGVGDKSAQVQGDAMSAGAAGPGGSAAGDGPARQDLKGMVTQMAGEMREEALSLANERRDAFSDRLDAMGEAVRRSGNELREQQPWLADLIDRGAGQLGAVAGRLRDNDVRTSFEQLRTFAERQPALFAGAALVAGFVGGRLVQMALGGTAPADGGMEAHYG